MPAVTLAEVKAHLNIASTSNDDELGIFMERAEAAVAARCGPLVATSRTSRVRGGYSALALPSIPVLSLTSITPVGASALTVGDYFVTTGGVVEPTLGGSFGSRWYDVEYLAGHADIADDLPSDLRLAVLEMVRHLWDTQRAGGSRRVGSAASDTTANTIPGAAYLFPHRVEQLLAPYEVTL